MRQTAPIGEIKLVFHLQNERVVGALVIVSHVPPEDGPHQRLEAVAQALGGGPGGGGLCGRLQKDVS